jgi:hypothetical protein
MESNYITEKHGQIWEVRCKKCGVPIRGMRPDDTWTEKSRIGSQTIVRERLVLACYANYREVLIEMDDGSRHVTCLCETCANNVTMDELGEITAIDDARLNKDVPANQKKSRSPVAIAKIDSQVVT